MYNCNCRYSFLIFAPLLSLLSLPSHRVKLSENNSVVGREDRNDVARPGFELTTAL